MDISAEIKGVRAVGRALREHRRNYMKNLEAAMRVEGHNKKNLMQKELRQGRAGDQKLVPLSWIGSRYTSKLSGGGANRRRNRNKPLYALAHGIRYDAPEGTGKVYIGFVGPQFSTRRSWDGLFAGYTVSGGFTKGTISSSTWRRLAQMHAQGFTSGLKHEWLRSYWARRGSELGKRTKSRKYFFLKKTTSRFKTPARKIVAPFHEKYRDEMVRNISEGFRKKSRGERI